MSGNNATSIEELYDSRDATYTHSFESRFWSNVNVGTKKDCWQWTAGTTGHGYGSISFFHEGRQHQLKAHRVSKFLDVQDDISSKQVNHSCHNKLCVNPSHIYLGTQSDNISDDKARNVSRAQDALAEEHGVSATTRSWWSN